MTFAQAGDGTDPIRGTLAMDLRIQNDARLKRWQRPLSRIVAVVAFAIACLSAEAEAAHQVGVIGDSHAGGKLCEFLKENGFACTLFPFTGPTGSVANFDVLIDLSGLWEDPDAILSDHLRAGNGVIVWGAAATALGIEDDPLVQAWIGANGWSNGSNRIIAVAEDPILVGFPPGSTLGDCANSFCQAVVDTTGHPNAKVLAVFEFETDDIGLLRNTWEGGRSVYMSDGINPLNSSQLVIFLQVVNQIGPPIPTVSHWGLAVMTLLLLSAGSVVLKRKALEEVRS